MNSYDIPAKLPWYRSKVIVGAAISILTKVLVMSGAINEIAPADAESLANLIVLIGGGIGDLVAIGARVAQKAAPPISVTK